MVCLCHVGAASDADANVKARGARVEMGEAQRGALWSKAARVRRSAQWQCDIAQAGSQRPLTSQRAAGAASFCVMSPHVFSNRGRGDGVVAGCASAVHGTKLISVLSHDGGRVSAPLFANCVSDDV